MIIVDIFLSKAFSWLELLCYRRLIFCWYAVFQNRWYRVQSHDICFFWMKRPSSSARKIVIVAWTQPQNCKSESSSKYQSSTYEKWEKFMILEIHFKYVSWCSSNCLIFQQQINAFLSLAGHCILCSSAKLETLKDFTWQFFLFFPLHFSLGVKG